MKGARASGASRRYHSHHLLQTAAAPFAEGVSAASTPAAPNTAGATILVAPWRLRRHPYPELELDQNPFLQRPLVNHSNQALTLCHLNTAATIYCWDSNSTLRGKI